MFHRPWPIVVIAVFHILAPIFNLFLSSSLLGVDVSEYLSLQMRRDPMFLPVWMLLPVACGISLLTFRKWSYYLFLAFMLVVLTYTLRQRMLFPHRVPFLTFMGLQFINLSVIAYFISPSVKTIFLNKKIRWWQQKPRYEVPLAADVTLDDQSVPAVIQNISEGGLYLTASLNLVPNKHIQIKFKYDNQEYDLNGLIVHIEKQSAGVLFNLNGGQKRSLKKLCRDFKSKGLPARGRELTNRESFRLWARDLFKSGHGLFPQTHQRVSQVRKS